MFNLALSMPYLRLDTPRDSLAAHTLRQESIAAIETCLRRVIPTESEAYSLVSSGSPPAHFRECAKQVCHFL